VSYSQFLESRAKLGGFDGFTPDDLPSHLFDFQRDLVTWACQKGRGAIFADCGLGKTPMQLAWADQVHRHDGRPVLILTPLAVAAQTVAEARKFNVDAAVSRDGKFDAPITVTNYEQLHRFDPSKVAGVVCDESSAIKAFDGQRRAEVTEFMRLVRFRLLATATAAPNDYVELGTSSEALGQLGYMDMLGRFFTNSQRTSRAVRNWSGAEWRFKGHAEQPFWRWVSSWARACRRPSDLGYSDEQFVLPDLIEREHIVEALTPREGALFDTPAIGLQEEREAHRRTIGERCEKAAELVGDAESAVVWCQLNDESRRLTEIIDGAVEIKGSDSVESKEEALQAFVDGSVRVLVTKPTIGGYGLNWQHCNRMVLFPSHSYEQYYQAVRRCWRFGQQRPVTVDLVTTTGGVGMLANLRRKARAADEMFASLVLHMRDAQAIDGTVNYSNRVEVPSWAA